jgi:hypothetical protein
MRERQYKIESMHKEGDYEEGIKEVDRNGKGQFSL